MSANGPFAANPPHPVPPTTPFRSWMEQLRGLQGNRPQWPLLLRLMLEAEFVRQQQLGYRYEGQEVFMDRDEHDWTRASGESRCVYGLYHRCRVNHPFCFPIDETPYWLLGYEWPNQGREAGRCADLVGMTPQGGLVVFECKLENNNDTPFTALLEGLDYLACLTTAANLSRIQQGFRRWRGKPGQRIPPGFEDCQPSTTARHEVIVLAPRGYWDRYREGNRGDGWPIFAHHHRDIGDNLRIDMAETDFRSCQGTWVARNPP